MHITITSEQLGYWYLRLNGFLTIPNFVVHPDTGGGQRTDVDILGVRFPHRAELLLNSMADDKPFTDIRDKPYIIIAEVKRGECNLNGPWVRPGQRNMQRVLRAVGAFRKSEVEKVAQDVYKTGVFQNESYYLSLCCFGGRSNSEIQKEYPHVPQKLWDEVLRFMFDRFRQYRRQKASHGQWDKAGTDLWNCAERSGDVDEFKRNVTIQG